VGVPSNLPAHSDGRPCVSFIFFGAAVRVRFVVGWVLVTVTLHCHWAVTEVVCTHAGAVGAVDGDLLVVGSKSVALSVGVVQHTALKHLVHGRFDTGNQVRGRERRLLSLSVVVGGVSIQSDFADWDQRVVLVGPDLCNVKYIVFVCRSILLRHSLHEPGPAGVVTLLDVFK